MPPGHERFDAVFGASLPVTVRTAAACDACQATGAAPGTSATVCSTCGGSGQVRRVRQSLLGQMVTAGPCHSCAGVGQIITSPCSACRGEGRVLGDRTYTVEVPAGVDTGSTLRLTGRGAVGPRGGGAGDLYVHLRVAPHEHFLRDGDDLVTQVTVSFPQAALGATITIQTLDGEETLQVEPGSAHGKVVTFRGKGVPRLGQRKAGRGDLRVVLAIDVPTKLSVKEEDLLRAYAAERGDVVSDADQSLLGRIKSAFS